MGEEEGGGVPIVGHFVHEGVAHCGGCFVVDAVLALRGEEVFFFDFVGPDALGDTDHPEKLRSAGENRDGDGSEGGLY